MQVHEGTRQAEGSRTPLPAPLHAGMCAKHTDSCTRTSRIRWHAKDDLSHCACLSPPPAPSRPLMTRLGSLRRSEQRRRRASRSEPAGAPPSSGSHENTAL